MNRAIFASSFFPNTNYVRRIIDAGTFTIDLGEHFIKQTNRSRCDILGPNGTLQLVVPLKKWKDKTPTREIQMADNIPWKKQHWKTIESAYRASPYFEYYEEALHQLYFNSNSRFLWELNHETILFLIKTLSLRVSLEYTDEYIEADELDLDFRNLKAVNKEEEKFTPYIQVFSDRHPFIPNLSLLDLICNLGPDAVNYIP